MRALSAAEVLRLWETSGRLHPVDLALTLLATVLPEIAPEDLQRLTVGQRDERLLQLRGMTFGPRLRLETPCPDCQEALELEVEVAALQVGAATSEGPYETVWDGWQLQWRLPDSRDLAALVPWAGADPGQVADALLARCLLAIRDADGEARELADLPSAARELLEEAMAAVDPQAEVLFDLNCPRCEHRWQSLLDIVEVLVQELAMQSRRLLAEVHFLARYYGWREADILALSGRRRQAYLDLAGA